MRESQENKTFVLSAVSGAQGFNTGGLNKDKFEWALYSSVSQIGTINFSDPGVLGRTLGDQKVEKCQEGNQVPNLHYQALVDVS